jgi:hypothetical protein
VYQDGLGTRVVGGDRFGREGAVREQPERHEGPHPSCKPCAPGTAAFTAHAR